MDMYIYGYIYRYICIHMYISIYTYIDIHTYVYYLYLAKQWTPDSLLRTYTGCEFQELGYRMLVVSNVTLDDWGPSWRNNQPVIVFVASWCGSSATFAGKIETICKRRATGCINWPHWLTNLNTTIVNHHWLTHLWSPCWWNGETSNVQTTKIPFLVWTYHSCSNHLKL